MTEVLNPSDQGEVVGYVAEGTADDVEAAVRSAVEAQPAWASLSATRRADILSAAAAIVRRSAQELAELEMREIGKVLTDARGEVNGAASFLEYHSGDGYRASGEVVASTRESAQLFTHREPLGAVAVITPWNFPFSSAAKKIAPTLLCGNTCVLKPSEWAPGISTRFVEILLEAGVPSGVVNMVHGSAVVGRALTTNPDISAITFTGSSHTGIPMAQEASGRGVRVQAEMGGKNALVVLADADVDRAVEMCATGAFRHEGQLCTATSRALVHADVHDVFLERLLARVATLRFGDPADEQNDAGPLVSKPQFERVMGFLTRARENGARIRTGGARASGPELDKGYYVEPTVLTDVAPDMEIAREEVFGPVLAVLPVEGLDHAIELTNDTPYGLTGAIHTRDMRAARQFIERAHVGFVSVNLPTTGMELQVPGGGVKASGWGPKEHGRTALEFFSDVKSVAMSYA